MNPVNSPSPQPKSPGALPSPGAAVAVFTVALALNLLIALGLGSLGAGSGWILVVTPLALLALTAAAVAALGVDSEQTLLFRLPSVADVLMAVPLALSLFVLNDQLSTLTQSFFPLPEQLETSMRELLRIESASDWVFKVATMGIGAAVSEELLFRGFIQNAFLGRMGGLRAVLLTSFLFMVIHTLPLPSFAAAGVVLGLSAVGSKSILVPIVVHFVHNVSALALLNLGQLDTLADPLWIPPSILLPALAIFVLSIGHFVRKMPERVPTDAPSGPRPELEAGPEREGGRPGSDEPAERNEALVVPAPSVADELSTVPVVRRRLGWLVLVSAVGFGLFVLSSLIIYSVYSAGPEQFRAAMLDGLEQFTIERLAPEAQAREEEVRRAFTATETASNRGDLSVWGIVELASRCSQLALDERIDDAEVDDLLAILRAANGTTDAPRRL